MRKIFIFLLLTLLVLSANHALAQEKRIGLGGKISVFNSFVGSLGLRIKLTPCLNYEMNYLALPAQFTPEGVPYNSFDLTLIYLLNPDHPFQFCVGAQLAGILRGTVSSSFLAGLVETRYIINDNSLGRLFIALPYPGGISSVGIGGGFDYYF